MEIYGEPITWDQVSDGMEFDDMVERLEAEQLYAMGDEAAIFRVSATISRRQA